MACHYCQKTGCSIANCWIQQYRESNDSMHNNMQGAISVNKVADLCRPFISEEQISLVDNSMSQMAIQLLRDTGASQPIMKIFIKRTKVSHQ